MRHLDLLNNYVTYVGLDRTHSTQRVHREKLGPLLRSWDHLDPAQFTREEFERYLVAGKEKGWKPRTHQMLLDTVRSFIKWAQDRGHPIPDFAKGLKKPRVHRTNHIEYYEQEEVAKLLKKAGSRSVGVMVAMGFYAGCRRTEVYNADWADVDWDAKLLTVHGTKTYFDRTVPLAKPLYDVLRSRWRGQKKGRIVGDVEREAWLSNLRLKLQRLCKRAGVPYRASHALRRGFATTLLQKGADLGTLRALGGWRDLTTVSRYAGSSSERQRAAVALLDP